VRYGKMRHIAELSYDGKERLGCNHRLVIRTRRGTEIASVLSTACSNGGCGKSLSRDTIREYIANSGAQDYPFSEQGRVIREATADDLLQQQELEAQVKGHINDARRRAEHFRLPMKVVDVEPILGGELLTVYFVSEDRVDFRALVSDLASHHRTRIEMRQVGARDEARLVADYEKCGQHCCCRQFLKVLKPVSMKAAKTQKATLDPTKISGRCGRLMCCLRYEEKSYEELKRLLPRRRSRVGTPHGPGIVLDGQILTQLVLVRLEDDGQQVAVPVEDLCHPDECPEPAPVSQPQFAPPSTDEESGEERQGKRKRRRGGRKRKGRGGEEQTEARQPAGGEQPGQGGQPAGAPDQGGEGGGKKRRKRRRRRKKGGGQAGGGAPTQGQGGGEGGQSQGGDAQAQGQAGGEDGASGGQGGGQSRKKRRRRRRKKRGGSGGQGGGGGDSRES
jgi:cell fate regulator YaaT (PSP1 superfamily)